MRTTRIAFLFSLIAFSVTVSAQDNVTWDNSGNSMLSGTYHFRQVVWQLADAFGDFNDAEALYGNITFDGNGNYTMACSFLEAVNNPSPTACTQPGAPLLTGTYRISAGGLGYLDSQIFTGGHVWGTVSNGGVFIGSSTEDGTAAGTNDIFIAAKFPASTPTIASFNGSYAIAEMSTPGLSLAAIRDAMFQINPDGAGHLGTLNPFGYIGNGNTEVIPAPIVGATYSFDATGLGKLQLNGTPGTDLVAGQWLFYVSPDGRFIFGGSSAGFDIFVGVLAPPTTTAPANWISGLYGQAGVDFDLTNFSASASSNLSTYFGTFQATGGTIVGHQRLLNGFDGTLADYTPYDYTYSDTLTINPDGTMNDFLGRHYVIGASGDIRVGIGTGVVPGINVTLRAPVFSGPGVFLNPTGVTNLFSSAPYSVGVSPGAFMVLSGTGLTGVNQVLVNGREAFINSVSDTQVVFVVPYATSGTAASIQVINSGGGSSATLTVFATTTTPGVLASQGGAGEVIAQHLDYSLVTENNPAQPGEIILLYVEGLGSVSPAIADGVAAPLSPLSPEVAPLQTLVDGENATMLFAGLTPTLIADYALIVIIPSDLPAGDAFVDVSGPDSITDEATIPVGGGVLPGPASVDPGQGSGTTTLGLHQPRSVRPLRPAPTAQPAQ